MIAAMMIRVRKKMKSVFLVECLNVFLIRRDMAARGTEKKPMMGAISWAMGMRIKAGRTIMA